MSEEELKKLLMRAGNYTAKYEKSSKEVADKLRQWSGGEVSEEEVNTILEELKADGFIDEVRFTERYVRDKMISYRKGPMMIRQELRLKGISSEVIEDELSKVSDEEWSEQLRDYLNPRLEKHRKKAKNMFDLRMRMGQLSYGRGYMREISDSVIEELLADVELDEGSEEYWYD